MESDTAPEHPDSEHRDDERRDVGSETSVAAARDALSGLDDDGARLAERVVTPWWYHPALGLIVALFVGTTALPGPASVVVIALGIIALLVLTTTYSRRYGVSVNAPAGRRSRRMLAMIMGILIALMLSALVIKLAGASPLWALLPAAAAWALTVVLGRRYDDVLRAELTGRGDEGA